MPEVWKAKVQASTPRSTSNATRMNTAGQMINGLKTVPEIESIRVHEANVAPFSMPQEALSFIPDESAVVSCYKNGATERKLYCNTELSAEEQQNLRRLQEEANAQNRAFLPSIAAAAMRYVTRARGDPKRALREMLATQEWRQKFFQDGPIIDREIAEDMAHGAVYYAGRDWQLHPMLVIRPARIPAAWLKENQTEKLTRLLVFSLEYMLRYLVFPGKIETSTIVIDLKGVTLGQLPTSALREIITVLSVHYILRVHRFYLCNVPGVIQRVSGLGLRLLTEKQKQKLYLVKNPSDIRGHFALHHLEEDLGGTRPILTQFFPFPMQAGPFTGGYSKGADPNATPHVHRAFTAAGMRGRAWDPALSKEANAEVEYTELAETIFKRCGSPPPKISRRSTLPIECVDQFGVANVEGTTEYEASQIDHPVQNDMPVLLSFGSAPHAASRSGAKAQGENYFCVASTCVGTLARGVPSRNSRHIDASLVNGTVCGSSHSDDKTMRLIDAACERFIDDTVRDSKLVGDTVGNAGEGDERRIVNSTVVDDVQIKPWGVFSCMICGANETSV